MKAAIKAGHAACLIGLIGALSGCSFASVYATDCSVEATEKGQIIASARLNNRGSKVVKDVFVQIAVDAVPDRNLIEYEFLHLALRPNASVFSKTNIEYARDQPPVYSFKEHLGHVVSCDVQAITFDDRSYWNYSPL